MRIRPFFLLLVALILPLSVSAQETSSGFVIPVTISGDARYARSSENGQPTSSGVKGGFRGMISPSLRLGSHWFAYSVFDTQSSSYLDYAAGLDNDRAVSFTLMQAYVGYKTSFKSASLLVKAGRLASAFGLYPLEYDDAKSPLIDPPLTYIANLPLRPDQLPCNLSDLIWQSYGNAVQFNCGGATVERYGIVPVTLYGIPGIETQLSWNRFDTRLHITNSSPANPQSLLSQSQSIQWTAGGGYSFHRGLHLGISAFRGPYLDHVLAPLLPAGQRLSDFPASGIGADLQWSKGPWSLEAEWQRFRFALPGFTESPSSQGAYVQLKRIVSPRLFVAFRAAVQQPGGAADSLGYATPQIDAREETEEAVLGYRISRLQLLKAGFTYGDRNAWSLGQDYWPTQHRFSVQIQLVTSLNAFAKAFR